MRKIGEIISKPNLNLALSLKNKICQAKRERLVSFAEYFFCWRRCYNGGLVFPDFRKQFFKETEKYFLPISHIYYNNSFN